MSQALRQLLVLVGKDLRIEARTRQTLGLVLTLGVLIVVVLGLGLGTQLTGAMGGYAASAVLWVAYLFGGVMCFEKTMATEREDGALAGLLLTPVDRGVLFVAKLVTNLVLMVGLGAVVTPVGVVLFGFDLSAAPGRFTAVIGLSMLGFAAVGTLFAAVVSGSRLQGGLLAVLVFPLSVPLVIASTRMLLGAYRDGQPLGGTGLAVLVAFDAIFLVISWWTYEWMLEP